MRGRTSAKSSYLFPGANMSPDSGAFPFYIWSLADISTTYLPSLFAGVTENTAWDGNNYDFWYAETGNRVFILLQQHYTGTGADVSLWSCAGGLTQGATPQQNLANFARMPMSTFAGQATRFEFAGEKVRLIVGTTPLTSAATDAGGWVTYTGTNGSGRVTAPLGATRFWLTLAGGDPVGSREMIIADKPKVVTRFTYDGSVVTATSPIVTNQPTLTRDVTIRARAYSAADGESAEAQAKFAFTMPLLPGESYVSPVDINVPHATLDGTPAVVSVDGPSGNKAGVAIGGAYYLVRYPLSATVPTSITLHRSGLADVSTNIIWRVFDLGAYGAQGAMTIRYGDSLLLTAGVGQTGTLAIAVTDTNGAAYCSHAGVAGQTFPTLFNQAGTYAVSATLNGFVAGTLVVTVVQVDMQGPIACQIGYRREKEMLVYSPTNGIVFTANDGSLLEASVKEGTARGARLHLKALTNGTPVIQARLGSATGAIVSQQEVDEFTLKSQATMYIWAIETFPDGSRLLQTYLEMTPKVENLIVRMHIIIRGVTFEDSTLDMELNTSDFTYNAASGKWLYAYRMIASPDIHTGSCHDIAVYQGSEQVGK